MATALSATARIVIPYTINGKTHKVRLYARGLTLVGGVYQINSRTADANDQVWTDCADAVAALMSNVFTTDASFGTASIQELTAGVWVDRAFHATANGGLAGTYYPTTELTVVLRDINLKKVKVVLLETKEISPQHSEDATAGDANMDLWVKGFLPTHTGAHDPYVWMVGRGNQYLNTTPFVGFTVCQNKKLRRTRGYA